VRVVRLLAATVVLAACTGGHAGSTSVVTVGAVPSAPTPSSTVTTVATTTIPVETTTIPTVSLSPSPFPTARPGIPVDQLPADSTVDAGITDNRLFLLGDSVMGTLRSGNTARNMLEPLGWKVTLDAVDGRFADAAITVLRDRRRDIGQVVVILIGNNYGGNEELIGRQFDTMLSLLDGVPRIVFLTVEEYEAKQAEVNAELRRVAADPRVTLVDWNTIVKGTLGANRPDGLHLTPFGAGVLARTIADAVGPAPPH
jgi:lysophospholipase L1-like esterase